MTCDNDINTFKLMKKLVNAWPSLNNLHKEPNSIANHACCPQRPLQARVFVLTMLSRKLGSQPILTHDQKEIDH